jgi:hypothetical protein
LKPIRGRCPLPADRCEALNSVRNVILENLDLGYEEGIDPGEPERYPKDVPNAEVYVLDAGPFALDTKADEIAALVSEFMKKQK